MKMMLSILLYAATCAALIVFALDWIIFGKYIPQAGSFGCIGYVGIVTIACLLSRLLEYFPDNLTKWR
jgi:hypothetical protein